jgi:hypothetical protein
VLKAPQHFIEMGNGKGCSFAVVHKQLRGDVLIFTQSQISAQDCRTPGRCCRSLRASILSSETSPVRQSTVLAGGETETMIVRRRCFSF